jgi:hypothetical protein
MQMYTLLTQDTNTVFINQLLISHAFRKVHIMLGSKFSIICHLISNGKAWCKISLKWYLNTHSLYSVDENLPSKKVTDLFKGCVNSISWQYWCMCVDVFLNSLVCNHCVFLAFLMWKLQLYCTYVFVCIWHIPHPTVILTNSGSRECNTM